MNKVAVDYIIVDAVSYPALALKVWRQLPKGWQPIGGVSFDGNQYLQAMVKYK